MWCLLEKVRTHFAGSKSELFGIITITSLLIMCLHREAPKERSGGPTETLRYLTRSDRGRTSFKPLGLNNSATGNSRFPTPSRSILRVSHTRTKNTQSGVFCSRVDPRRIELRSAVCKTAILPFNYGPVSTYSRQTVLRTSTRVTLK